MSGVETRTEVGAHVAKTGGLVEGGEHRRFLRVRRARAGDVRRGCAARATDGSRRLLPLLLREARRSIAPGVYAAVFRCKKFSDHGAQQLLLDVHALKTILCASCRKRGRSGRMRNRASSPRRTRGWWGGRCKKGGVPGEGDLIPAGGTRGDVQGARPDGLGGGV